MGSTSLTSSIKIVNTVSSRPEFKEQDHKSDKDDHMSGLLVCLTAVFLMSCSSFRNGHPGQLKYPEYQSSRQMDERSMEARFLEQR